MSALTRNTDEYAVTRNDLLPLSSKKKQCLTEKSAEIKILNARVHQQLDSSHWLLASGSVVKRAASCLLLPEKDDVVLCSTDDAGETGFILAVLEKAQCDEAKLTVEAEKVSLIANQLQLSAAKKADIQSLGDISINAFNGKLSLFAKTLLQQVQENLMQVCRHFIGRSEWFDRHTTQLARSHAKQQICTAEKELRMDADRINMG